MEIPKNKKQINGKYSTKNAIKKAIYDILANGQIEGRYADDNWHGIQKLLHTLHENNIDTELEGAAYAGHGSVEGTNLPTRKVYKYILNVRDKEGKNIPLNLIVNCIFVGQTGTMVDKQYELTFYFTN